MSSIVISGDTSGSVTLQAPAVSGATTLTLPAVSGTVVLNNSADQTINGLTVGKGGGSVSQNTVVGANSGVANTTGKITAVGYLAARFNTTGSGLTAIGGNDGAQDGALYYNTTGNYNIALGTGALSNNTTASNNTGLGYQALNANTTTSRNTAVGYQASLASTTAENTCIGYIAGYTNVSGANNTYVGSQAGANATGSNNTFVGQATGSAISTGAKNTIIGTYNGNQGGLDIRTASNYIVLSDGDGNPAIYNRPAGVSAASGKNTTVFGMVDAPVSGETVTVNCNNNSTASNSYGIIVSGRPTDVTVYAMRFYNANASTIVGSIQINPTTTTYATSSDYRLKENITPMTGALDTVVQLNPVTYKWKQDGSDGQGFIAHELQAVVPDAVVGEKDAVDEEGKPVYQGIDTSFLVATLTAAIQELNAKVIELEAKLESK